MFFLSLCSTFLINPRRNNLFDKYHDTSGTLPLSGGFPGTSIMSECLDLALDTQALERRLTINYIGDSNPMSSSTTPLTNENQSVCTQMTLLSG